MPQGCVKGRFPLIPFTDVHKVVGIMQVKLGKDGGALKGLKSRVDEGQWIFILYSDIIQTSEDNTQSECPILLPYKKEPGSQR